MVFSKQDWKQAVALGARSGLLVQIGAALSEAVDRMPLDQASLLATLHNKLVLSDIAERRSVWFGGRWYNRMAGEDPQRIELPGRHMQQVYERAGKEPGIALDAARTYSVKKEFVRRVRDDLEQELAAAGVQLPPL